MAFKQSLIINVTRTAKTKCQFALEVFRKKHLKFNYFNEVISLCDLKYFLFCISHSKISKQTFRTNFAEGSTTNCICFVYIEVHHYVFISWFRVCHGGIGLVHCVIHEVHFLHLS